MIDLSSGHLASRWVAGFVLVKGSISLKQSSEGEIRRNITEAGLVDYIVALPGQLFHSTQILACFCFLRRGCGAPEAALLDTEIEANLARLRFGG